MMRRIGMVGLLVSFLLGSLYLSVRLGDSLPAAAFQAGTHKVIVPAGVLAADGRSGFTLWHDYGAFALYRASDTALAGLSDTAAQRVRVADEMDRILIDAYPFDTQRDLLDLPVGWGETAVSGPTIQLIQFVGPIKAEWLDAVEATGSVLIHYVANNAYLVWTDGNGRSQLQTLLQTGDFLQYSAPYPPYFKLGKSLADRLAAGEPAAAGTVPVTIQMLRHPDQSQTETFLKKRFVSAAANWQPVRDFQNIAGMVRLADIPAIAARPDVLWIGEQFERERMDEVQGQILAANFDGGMTGPGNPGYLAWLDSFNVSHDPADYPIVDITDDGIGNGTVNSGDATLHQLGNAANPTRLAYIANCTAAADGSGPDGHGHINMSIAGGYDGRSGFPFQDGDGFQRGLGVNPYGRFAGTRIFTSTFDLSNCGNTETKLIQQTQNNGAQISSNSWGCSSCAGTYDTSSQAYDVGVRDADLTEPGNQELTFVFAAGNSGNGSGTIGTPGNGKNVITVGASENDRPTWLDGCNIAPTGADNAMDIISFSSRGPAPGNRVKPELVAPGTHIQGTASSSAAYNGTGVCDPYQPGGQTAFAASSGTSHSTPAVAGVASLYYYWLENQYRLPSPSPAVIKAYLIAHPTYLTGFSANDDLPSNNQGFGMPNMSLALDNTPRYILDQAVILNNSGETWTFSGAVADPGKPLRIVLAYTDQEGLVGTSPQVNDLNLTAQVGGSIYLGNNFSGEWSMTGGTADSANNTEAVFLPAGISRTLIITVTAFNIAGDGVPNGGDLTDQDFALVCYNCTEQPDFFLQAAPTAQLICAPDEAAFDVMIGQVSGYDQPVTLSAAGAFTTAFSANPVIPPDNSLLTLGNTNSLAAGDYEVIIWGIAPTSTHTTTVSLSLYNSLPGNITLITPTNGITNTGLAPTFTWQTAAQAASYTLEVAEDSAFNAIVYTTTVKGVEHTLPQDLAALTTYYWRVRADNVCGAGAMSSPYSFTTALIACSAPALPITDNDALGVSSDLLVTEAVSITDLNVLLDVSHPWVGDLSFVLEHVETGARATLVDRPGYPEMLFGCSGDDIGALLDDEAAVLAEDTCALSGVAISGSVAPNEPLAVFDGKLWPGTWRLTAIDNELYDTGTLNRWCLLPAHEVRLNHDLFLPLIWR